MRTFACSTCGVVVASDLQPLGAGAQLNHVVQENLVPPGTFVVAGGLYEPGECGDFILNLGDLRNTKRHSDPRRLNGCCGLDGADGYNLVCQDNHEIGTEVSDCGTEHFAILSCTRVKDA